MGEKGKKFLTSHAEKSVGIVIITQINDGRVNMRIVTVDQDSTQQHQLHHLRHLHNTHVI